MAAAFTVPAVFKAIDRVTAPVRKMQASMTGFGNKTVFAMQKASIPMNRFNQKINAIGAKIKGALGTFGLVAGFTALTMIGGNLVKTFADFESIIGLKKLNVFHLNDSKMDLSSKKDRHERIGRGYIGQELFQILLNNKKFEDIHGILEIPGGTDVFREDLDLLRSFRND